MNGADQMLNPEKEFRHHLHDTIILLGGGTLLANMVNRDHTLGDVDELRKLNCRLIDATKTKLCEVHSTSVQVME